MLRRRRTDLSGRLFPLSAWSEAVMFLAVAYPWIKALHIIAVIAWMAGMLYLPRLFVYHVDATPGSAQSETFKVMERRLLKAIINPSMIAAVLLGLTLLAVPGLVAWSDLWIWIKLVGVAGLVGIHHLCVRAVRAFAEDRNTRPARYWRVVNEVPALLMLIIVIMVVVKPF
jgi:putative membrane protein